ncbi:MAG: type II toxin-antitoxin system RelE/ParE family toxin [Candidatus Paceibacterota bacterium]|jgi:plasmid maintenance system killer protein
MLNLIYAPIFVKKFNKLEENLQDEVIEKIELFKDARNHKILKVHKLHGQFKNCYSFSVNYEFRIIFSYASKKDVDILAIGGHDIYK